MEMDFLCVIYFSAAVLHYSCSYERKTEKFLLYFEVCKIPAAFFNCISSMCSNNLFHNKCKCMCVSVQTRI